MYDDKNIEVQDKAMLLIIEIRRALNSGTLHFRKSDGSFLGTEREILQALVDEGGIVFESSGG